jgi:hypothetical protein
MVKGLFTLIRMGRAGGTLPAAQGAASDVYSTYMGERQRCDVGKASRSFGLRLRGRHALLRALALEWLGRCGARLAWQPRKHNATYAD